MVGAAGNFNKYFEIWAALNWNRLLVVHRHGSNSLNSASSRTHFYCQQLENSKVKISKVAWSEPVQGLPGVVFTHTSPSSLPSMWLTQRVLCNIIRLADLFCEQDCIYVFKSNCKCKSHFFMLRVFISNSRH